MSYPEYSCWAYGISELISYAMLLGGGTLVWRFIRAYEHRSIAPRDLQSLAGRMDRLEDAVDDVSSRTERVAEEQQFTTHLLISRSSAPQK